MKGGTAHQVGESAENGGHKAQPGDRRGEETYPGAEAGLPVGGRRPLVVGRPRRPVIAVAAAAAATKVGRVVVEVVRAVGAEAVRRVEVAAEFRVKVEVVEAGLLKKAILISSLSTQREFRRACTTERAAGKQAGWHFC